MRFILLLLSLNCVSAAEPVYRSLLAQTGIQAIISGFDADFRDAATRHARRCDASQTQIDVPSENLISAVAAGLKKNALLTDVQFLEEWYNSATGRKITLLEQSDIAESEIMRFQTTPDRTEQIVRIYNNTGAGILSSSVAVELEYAGWLASGCLAKVRRSKDAAQIEAEQIYGGIIREQGEMLETLFRQDTLHTMEFILFALSDTELLEYAEVTHRSSGLYKEIIQSLISAIQNEIGD